MRLLHTGWIVLVLVGFLTPGTARAERRDDTGWFNLQTLLGGAMPDGQNITVLHVEAPLSPGVYLPFIGAGTGEFLGKTDFDLTGGGAVSSHASFVGQRWYGNTQGYAPGITTIQSYEAGDFLVTVLRVLDAVPSAEWSAFIAGMDPGPARSVNNSWILSNADLVAQRTLRRTDFQTDFYGLIFVNGMNNGAATTAPPGLSSSFNGMTVGLTNGNSSAGPTLVEGARMKPDLVAPDTATSWAAGQVSGAAVMLLDQAIAMGSVAGQKPQVVKAIMQAGAEKIVGWEKGDPGTADDVVHPLDWRFGAGEIQVDRNYDILAAGESLPNTGMPQGSLGWANDTLGLNETDDYIVDFSTANNDLAVALVWHRHHTGNFSTDAVWPLNNLALELWETDAALQPTVLVQESRSLVDNVQHLYAIGLPGGAYLVRLVGLTSNSPGPEDYGLAWINQGIQAVGDMNCDGVIDLLDAPLFTQALVDPAGFVACDGIDRADINGDALDDGEDVQGFIGLLLGP